MGKADDAVDDGSNLCGSKKCDSPDNVTGSSAGRGGGGFEDAHPQAPTTVSVAAIEAPCRLESDLTERGYSKWRRLTLLSRSKLRLNDRRFLAE